MIILGSSSPRRKEIMKSLVNEFEIIVPNFDEESISKNTKKYALEISKNKAFSIKNLVKPQDFIITCDTIVKLNNEILGKPKDLEQAKNYLRKLSNHKHEVISGVTYIYGDKIVSKEIKSKVYFNKLSEEQIENYVTNEKVLDKAGGYAIQDDEQFHLVRKIKGSYTNIVGFPEEYVSKILKKFKFIQ